MGGAALLIFIWAVRYQQFRNFEDVKYQVFWSELVGPEEPKEAKEAAEKPVSLAEFVELVKGSPVGASQERPLSPSSRTQYKELQNGYSSKEV